jgi:exonuclease VII large subunit
MRINHHWVLLPLLVTSPTSLHASDCVPIHEAVQYVGEVKCVTGKVLHVKVEDNGIHFVDFCEERKSCPFSVVVFASDLEDVGDVRLLEGQVIEVNGAVKLHEGRPQIILNRIKQIKRGAVMIPPLPKNYDVENRGHYSAGHLHPSKKPKKVKQKPSPTAIYGNDVEGEEPPD